MAWLISLDAQLRPAVAVRLSWNLNGRRGEASFSPSAGGCIRCRVYGRLLSPQVGVGGVRGIWIVKWPI